MAPDTTRFGRVLLLAGWVGNQRRYESALVRDDGDGTLSYYHGGATCRTADGWVTLPAEYHDAVTWEE
jgi:hypothetical protein